MFFPFLGWLRQISNSRSGRTRCGRRPASRSLRSSWLTLEPLEDRLAPAVLTDTWTGIVSNSWSVAGNWTNGTPAAGDALVFPRGVSNKTNVNNLASSTLFSSISFQDSGYAITGSPIKLSGGISTASTVAGIDTFAPNIALTANQTFNIDGAGAKMDVGGIVSGAGFGITKSGSGLLVFDGTAANTFTGATTVNAGILQLAKSSGNAIAGALVINAATVNYASSNQIADTSQVTINAFGVLALTGSSDKIGSLSLTSGTVTTGTGTLTLGGAITTTAASLSSSISGKLDLGGVTQTVTVADGSAPNDLVVSAAISDGGINKQGAGRLVLSGTNTYAGVTTLSAGILEVESSSALGGTAGGTTVAANATLQLSGTGLSFGDALTLNGTGVNGAGALENVSGSNTWAGTVSLATTSTVGVDAGQLTIGGVVSGSGGLTKAGAGLLVLQGTAANTFTGATTVNAGILQLAKSAGNAIAGALVIGDGSGSDQLVLAAANQIADTAAVTINSSGLLNLNSFNETIGSLTLVGGTVSTGPNGTLTLNGNVSSTAATTSATITGNLSLGAAARTFTVADGAAANDLVIAAVIGGNPGVGLTKAGPGNLLLSGANTYSGSTTVSAGTLSVGNSAALGSSAVGTTVMAGASVADDGVGGITTNLTLNGVGVASGGALQGSGGWLGTVTLATNTSIGVAAGTLTVVGQVKGTGALTKVGTGTLVLTAANTYSNSTTISAGILGVGNSAALGGTAGGTTVAANATLQLSGTGLSFGDALTLNGTGVNGAGALENVSGSNTWAGTVSLATTSTVGVDAGQLTIGGVVSGSGGLTKAGAGLLVLQGTAANTFTGATTVNAGILQLAKSAGNAIAGALVIGDGSGSDQLVLAAANQIADTAAVTINSSGLLNLNSFNETIGSLTLVGGTVSTGPNGTLTLNGNVSSTAATTSATITGNLSLGAAARTFTVADGAAANDLVIAAVIGGNPGVGLTKAGPGNLLLSGANTYSGSTTVSAGTLSVGNSAALGSSAVGTTVMAGASVADDGVGGITTNLTLNGVGVASGGALQGSGGWLGTVTLATNTSIGVSPGLTLTLNGVVSGAGSLTELAGGTLVLTAANTYAGGTSVNGGTLEAENTSGVGTGPGLVSVNSSGTLTGNGIVGNVLVASGATLAPGSTALTTGSVAFDAGATLTINLNDPDQLDVTGTVNLGGATLNLIPNMASGTTQFTLISTDSVTGIFAGLPEGSLFTLLGTANFTISYQGGTGNDVVLTQAGAPTPPPTSAIGFHFLATVHGQYVSGGSVSQVSGGNLANGATEQFTTSSFDNATGDYQGTLVTTTPDGSTFTSMIVGNAAADGTFSEVETIESGTNDFAGASGLTFAQGVNPQDGRGFVAEAMGTTFFAAHGVYNAADWGNQITGVASANGSASVQKVEVSIQDTTTGLFWDGSAFESTTEDFLPAAGTSSWSFAFSPSNLTNGHSYTIHSRTTDTQNNVQTALGSATFTYDTTAPDAPANLQATSATNGLTNVNEPTLSGAAEANSSVQVFLDGDYIGQAVANPSGSWTFTVPTPLADCNYVFTATATDAAGNVSSASAPLPLTIDTVAPTSEVASSVQLTVHGQPTGPNTSVSQLSGNGPFNGATETYTQNSFVLNSDFTGGSFTATVVDTAPDGGTETLETTGTVVFATGAVTEQLVHLSGTGQFGGVTGQSITRGTSFADGSFLGFSIGTVFSNVSHSYNATNLGDRITGLASAGGQAGVQGVAVSIQDTTSGKYWDGTAFESSNAVFLPATGTTSWSLAFSHNNLTNGDSYLVSSQATDTAGNVQTTLGTATFTYDTTAPNAPANLQVTTPTTVAVPNITGTAEANSSVQVFANGNYIGQAVANVSGNWTLTAVKALVDGNYNITATATDAAGNISPTSAQLPITITAPQAGTITGVGSLVTTATNVNWTVTFNTQVQGLTATNFAFTGSLTNTPNLSIASVTTSDGGATWTVTTNPVLGSPGTLGLELSNGSGVTDLSGNPLNPANLPLPGDTFTWPGGS